MAIPPVVFARNRRQLVELAAREETVGNRHPQHGRKALGVQAVLQAQRPELLLGQFAGEEPPGLPAELGDPLVHHPLVDVVVEIHAGAVVFSSSGSGMVCFGI